MRLVVFFWLLTVSAQFGAAHTYDSRDKRVGDFGVGWTLDVKNIRLQKNRNLGANWEQVFTPGGLGSYCLNPRRPRTVTITFPDGRTQKFQVTTSPECQIAAPIPVATVVYAPLANTRGSLVAEGQDADTVTTQGNTGTDLFTENLDTYNPTLYRYTTTPATRATSISSTSATACAR